MSNEIYDHSVEFQMLDNYLFLAEKYLRKRGLDLEDLSRESMDVALMLLLIEIKMKLNQ